MTQRLACISLRALASAALLHSSSVLAAQERAIPDDLIIRFDVAQKVTSGEAIAADQFRLERMPPGWHMTTTTSGVSVFPRGRSVVGPWGIEVELFVFPKPSNEPLGVIVESADGAPGTRALQFLMRPDGSASLVAVQEGAPTVLVPWARDTALAPHDGEGVIKYVLRVMHQGERLTFSINGIRMLSVETGGEDHRSIPGLRLGTGLNVHVSRFDLVTPLAPPAKGRASASRSFSTQGVHLAESP